MWYVESFKFKVCVLDKILDHTDKKINIIFNVNNVFRPLVSKNLNCFHEKKKC